MALKRSGVQLESTDCLITYCVHDIIKRKMSKNAGLLARHNEIQTALKFFLQSWYKHKQCGTVPDPNQVVFDFARYKSLGPVIKHLQTPASQPQSISSKARPGQQ